MSESDANRSYYHLRPDWRAEIPFGLLALKVVALVGIPVWLSVMYWPTVGGWLVPLFVWFIVGIQSAGATVKHTVAYRRKIRDGRIILDDDAARLPLPGPGWTRAPWEDVQAVRVIRAGGLFGDGLIRVKTRLHNVAIPGYVLERHGFVEELIERAQLDDRRSNWWATTWRRTGPTGKAQKP